MDRPIKSESIIKIVRTVCPQIETSMVIRHKRLETNAIIAAIKLMIRIFLFINIIIKAFI